MREILLYRCPACCRYYVQFAAQSIECGNHPTPSTVCGEIPQLVEDELCAAVEAAYRMRGIDAVKVIIDPINAPNYNRSYAASLYRPSISRVFWASEDDK